MKRFIPWVSMLSILLLVSCNLPSTGRSNVPTTISTATLSPAQIETEISSMLTVMPPATAAVPGAPAAGSPTVGLPTVSVEQASLTPEGSQPTQEAPAAATSTPEQQAELPTSTPTPTLAPATATPPPAGPTATLLPGDPRQHLGAPTSTDPMNNATTWVWPTGSDQYTSGTFSNGYQVITSLHKDDGWRMANPTGTSFTNTYLEATFITTTCSGSDHYGIILRVPVVNAPDQGYLFGVTCDGRYSLRRWNGEVQPKGEMKRLVDLTASPAIKTGSNQTNRLGIYAVGSRLILYVNGTLLTEVNDATYSSGYFGVFVGADVTTNLTVNVDEMSYWLNPPQP